MYLYIKAIHIIFVVTWFAGLFYLPRLFIYNREAQDKPEPESSILSKQFSTMSSRLLYGITLPSAILTVIFGTWMAILYGSLPLWLIIKLGFVLALLIYHFSLHRIFAKQRSGNFSHSSNFLRIWNEVATVFLVAIVLLASVKQSISIFWGLGVLIILIIGLISAIRIYKRLRNNNSI
ncbi:MAG: CopD family protein [Ferruginibacter sp.]